MDSPRRSCPSCGKVLSVPERLLGRNVRCPGCKLTFVADKNEEEANLLELDEETEDKNHDEDQEAEGEREIDWRGVPVKVHRPERSPPESRVRQISFGLIGLILAIVILGNTVRTGLPKGDGAYAIGQWAGIALGIVLLFGGMLSLLPTAGQAIALSLAIVILGNTVRTGLPKGGDAYAMGQWAGIVLGVALLFGGWMSLLMSGGRRREANDDGDVVVDPYAMAQRRAPGPAIAIITCLLLCGGLGFGVLIYAVARVRESAVRLQTNNNLKQCALAVHVHHDRFNRLPNGVSPGGQQSKDVPIWIHLLPFVEQKALYQSVAGGMAPFDSVVALYLAPSDPYVTQSAGIVNFAANVRVFGHRTLLANNQPVDQPGSAVQVRAGRMQCGLTLGKIEDGVQNVIMLSTRYANCGGQTTWFAVDASGNTDLGQPPVPGMGGFMGAGSATTPPSQEGPITAMFQLAPTDLACRPDAGLFGHSFGAGGMSVAMCDASVRNIAPTMSPLTFSRALCPADGQKHAGDWNAD